MESEGQRGSGSHEVPENEDRDSVWVRSNGDGDEESLHATKKPYDEDFSMGSSGRFDDTDLQLSAEGEEDAMQGHRDELRNDEDSGDAVVDGASQPSKRERDVECRNHDKENRMFEEEEESTPMTGGSSDSKGQGDGRDGKGGGRKVRQIGRKTRWEKFCEPESLDQILDKQGYPGLTCRNGEYFEMGFPGPEEELCYGGATGPTVEGFHKVVHSNATQGEKRLWIAVRAGKLEEVERLLDAGVSCVTPDKWGLTPLHMACAQGHKDVVKLLLTRGAHECVASRTEWLGTPLHSAAEWGRDECVQLLLEAGAEIDALDTNNQTALHVAAMLPADELDFGGDTFATVKLLIDAGLTPFLFPFLATRDAGKCHETHPQWPSGATIFILDINGNTPRDYVSDFPPFCRNNATRRFFPPATVEELSYYSSRGPPAGRNIVKGADGMDPEEEKGIPWSYWDVAKEGTKLRRSVPYTPSPPPEDEIDQVGYKLQREADESSGDDKKVKVPNLSKGRELREDVDRLFWEDEAYKRETHREYRGDTSDDQIEQFRVSGEQDSELGHLGNEVKEHDSGYEVDATTDSSVTEDFSIKSFGKPNTSFGKLNTRIWQEEEDMFRDLPEIPKGKPTRNAIGLEGGNLEDFMAGVTSLEEFEAMKQSALNVVQKEDFDLDVVGSDEKEGGRETDEDEEQGGDLIY